MPENSDATELQKSLAPVPAKRSASTFLARVKSRFLRKPDSVKSVSPIDEQKQSEPIPEGLFNGVPAVTSLTPEESLEMQNTLYALVVGIEINRGKRFNLGSDVNATIVESHEPIFRMGIAHLANNPRLRAEIGPYIQAQEGQLSRQARLPDAKIKDIISKLDSLHILREGLVKMGIITVDAGLPQVAGDTGNDELK